MRIALVTETYFPQINGVSRTLDRLVRHLADAGDRVRLFLPRYPEGEAELPRGVDARSYRSVGLPFYPEIRLPLVAAATLERELRLFRPDVVHITTEGSLGRAALKAAERLETALVSSYHTNFAQYLRSYRAAPLEPLCWSLLRRFHNRTAATFCPTPSIRAILEERGFERVRIWSRGVDAERFQPGLRSESVRRNLGLEEGERVLLYAGRLAAEKNLALLLEACGRLPRELGARLVLVGDGPSRAALERSAPEGTIFTGYRQGRELAELYAAADLFVFPSLTETFGNVILEAMASGLPAVGFDVPGPRDVIAHDRTGWLVKQVSAEALAEAVAGLLREPGRLLPAALEARRHAEGQTWSRINDGVRQVYLELSGKPSESRDPAAAGFRPADGTP